MTKPKYQAIITECFEGYWVEVKNTKGKIVRRARFADWQAAEEFAQRFDCFALA